MNSLNKKENKKFEITCVLSNFVCHIKTWNKKNSSHSKLNKETIEKKKRKKKQKIEEKHKIK
jgi:hypothetical protein